MNKMNKQEAYQAMLEGYTIRNEYYTSEEWLRIENGEIKTEEGYTMSMYDWNTYQDPEHKYEWEIVVDPHLIKFYEEGLISLKEKGILFERGSIFDQLIYYPECTKRQLNEVVIPVKPSTAMNRNLPCSCGSGLKTKKCKCYDKR